MDMKQELEALDAAYNEAFNRGDAAGCAAFFTDDVLLLAPGKSITRGKAAFEAIYEARIEQNSGGTHVNQLVEYDVVGDIAYQVGTYAIEGADPPEQGKFVNVLRRQANGTWKVSVSIFNSDLQE